MVEKKDQKMIITDIQSTEEFLKNSQIQYSVNFRIYNMKIVS